MWWVDFGEPLGSEPEYRRPAIVVSSDRFNRSRISTVVVVPVTSNLRLAAAPGNVELQTGEAGLDRDCVVNISQPVVIARTRMIEQVGTLARGILRKVDEGLRLVLSL